MKKIFLFLFFCSLSIFAQNKPTVYYFIRHAEKIDDSKDPDLSENGKLRVEKWKIIFENVDFNVVYSTNFKRTQQTASYVADAKKIGIINYDPKNINLDIFREQTVGKTVLIVGHSNSTPDFVNKLLKQNKYQKIDESVFGNLYILTIFENNQIADLLLKL